jgi:hypothetical protein
MSSNVDYTMCPICLNFNSAMVSFVDQDTYHIVCQYCEYEFESGRLPWESVRILDIDVWEESDDDDDDFNQSELSLPADFRDIDIYL